MKALVCIGDGLHDWAVAMAIDDATFKRTRMQYHVMKMPAWVEELWTELRFKHLVLQSPDLAISGCSSKS
jgi:hypothetical protein